MLKKLISIFIFSIALLPLIIISACEDFLSYEATICEIEFLANPDGDFWGNQDQLATMTEEISFFIVGGPGATTCWAPSIPFIHTAYAFSPCARFTNSLLQSTFTLSFDREFIYENETIAANTNLLNHPQIAAEIQIEINEDCDLYSSRLIFSTALRNASTFETDEYLVSFSCETSDERQFNDSARVIFRL
ncbi:MAG: hypothetical protein AAF927_30235 [Bacteroidota bacterium]